MNYSNRMVFGRREVNGAARPEEIFHKKQYIFCQLMLDIALATPASNE